MDPTSKREEEYADKFPEAANDWDLERLYADLRDVKQKLATSRNRQRVTSVEKACLRGLLCDYSPDEIATELIRGAKGLRVDLSRGLYRYVEELTGREPNSLKNWRDIPSWLEAAGYKTPPQSNVWGETPDVSVFYGRTSELDTLQQWIVTDRCRLVGLLGIVGIGKTALAAKLIQEIQDDFAYVIWRSLRHHAPPLNHLLADLILFLSNQPLSSLQENRNDKISLLLETFRQHRCLVVLDGWETIVQGGELVGNYQEEYDGYGQLLRRVGEYNHKSCLLLLSQEKPTEIALLEGNFVRSLQLDSLGKAALEILKEKGLSDPEYWHALIDRYGGNPLVLKLIAARIKDLFRGSVSNFLDQDTELGVVVPKLVKEMLDQQFDLLSALEKSIVCCIAINREAVSMVKLREYMKPETDIEDITEALESLVWRSLVVVTNTEAGESVFTLQPVLMKYVLREQKDTCDRLLLHEYKEEK